MLIGQDRSVVRSATPPSRGANPEPERDGAPDSALASRFREKLQELGPRHERPSGLSKHRKGAREDSEGVSGSQTMPQEFHREPKVDNAAVNDSAGKSVDAAGHDNRASVDSSASTLAGVDPFATSELAGRIAERLALPQGLAGDTHLLLDSSRYSVSNVTISGSNTDGLDFTYRGGSQDQGGSQTDEEGLRRRLEARGLKVGEIAREA